jgi:hypothetical protein
MTPLTGLQFKKAVAEVAFQTELHTINLKHPLNSGGTPYSAHVRLSGGAAIVTLPDQSESFAAGLKDSGATIRTFWRTTMMTELMKAFKARGWQVRPTGQLELTVTQL